MKYYNLSLADVVQRLKAMTPDDQACVKGSIAVTPHLTEKREDLVLAHFVPHNEQGFVRDELAYDEIRLVKESISVEDLCGRITSAAECGSFELFDGLKVDISDQASMELLPSEDPQTTRGARYYIQLTAKNRGILRQSDPLVKYGQLSFESAEQAVRAWIPLRPFHGNSDGRIGSLLIELPLIGPRLGAITTRDRLMSVEVAHMLEGTSVQLAGVWQSNDASFIEPFMKVVEETAVQISRPSQADQVAMWLTMPGTTVVDYFFESPYRCSRSQRVLYSPVAKMSGEESSVLAQIQTGEGENLEFKPFVKRESQKFDELIRTVIAFANKRGGTIYLGVTDYQEICGVEKELREFAPKEERFSVDVCADRFCSLVKKQVGDCVSGKIEFRVEPVRLCEKLLIRIVVKEGSEKPYSDVKTQEIWTRRGANTARPNPDELKQMIAGSTQGSGFLSLG